MMKPVLLTASQKESLSRFQIQVYEACMQIPSGKVATYKGIAQAINCGSSQAVGQALKRNPYNGGTPSVPCHRVVKTNMSVGGFSGSYSNADKKRKRLEEEGVIFYEDNGIVRVDKKFQFDFDSM